MVESSISQCAVRLTVTAKYQETSPIQNLSVFRSVRVVGDAPHKTRTAISAQLFTSKTLRNLWRKNFKSRGNEAPVFADMPQLTDFQTDHGGQTRSPED